MKQKEYMPAERINKYILSNYPYQILDITPIKFKDTDKQRAVYKIDTDAGPKCLKKVYFDESNLLFVYSVMQWFHCKNINVPVFLPTKSKGRYVNLNNRLFILTDWIDGRKLDYDVNDDIALAARNLAKMHKCSYNFHPIDGSFIRREDGNWYKTFNRRQLQLLQLYNNASVIKDKFSKIYIDSFDYFYSRALHSVQILNSLDIKSLTLPAEKFNTICHLDYVNKNLIIDQRNDVYVIDFDKSKIDIPIHDIGTFLKRILKRSNTNWSYDILMLTLKNYEIERQLDMTEIYGLYSFLEFPQKYWKIVRDYYSNIKSCNKKLFTSMLIKVCSQKDEHDLFCSSFQDYIEDRYSQKLIR